MKVCLGAAVAAAFAASAHSAIVQVTINGEVEYNQVRSGEFDRNVVVAGDAASITFLLDSDNFVNSPNFPTRGYAIDQNSFQFTAGSGSTGLQNPFPAGETPYFVIRDNDPGVDGFFLATNTDFPFGLPTNEVGLLGQFTANFSLSYVASTLPSLNLLDAVGTYGYDGLKVFHYTLDDGGFEPMGLIFESMTISVVPAPASLAAFGLVAGFARRRR